MQFEKGTDQNFITKNLRHGKEHCVRKQKKLLKQCLKEVIYEYILAFAGWWSSFWKMIGSGGYILGGGSWWMVVGGGYILDGGGWWWMVVGLGRSWLVVA